MPGGRGWRAVGFVCASTSIGALLAELYGIVSLRIGTLAVFLPACAVLTVMGLGGRRLAQNDFPRRLWLGLQAGFWATVAYDVWRLPFLLVMDPFKAHPIFGALITGLPSSSLPAQIVGWSYHASNGVSFAAMYAMAVPRATVRSAVLCAVGLEAAMLLTPYRQLIGLPLSAKFLIMSGSAHLVYGAVVGWVLKRRLNPTPLAKECQK